MDVQSIIFWLSADRFVGILIDVGVVNEDNWDDVVKKNKEAWRQYDTITNKKRELVDNAVTRKIMGVIVDGMPEKLLAVDSAKGL